MPGIGYDEAAEARRRAEEKARRREELQKQIDDWNDKKDTAMKQIERLETEQLKLHSYLKMWEEKKSIYSGNEILSEVVIINVFEGVCADKIKKDFTACIAEMDQTYSKVSGLRESVNAQLANLNLYVSLINTTIASLANELNFI